MAKAIVTAGAKRAVSGMEQAIAETHARLAAGGSAKELQKRAVAALSSSTLRTEREGRMFAVEVLERLEEADTDEACIYPYGDDYTQGDEIKPWRKGPQWDGLQKDLFRIFHEGTEAAQLGFCSIFTGVLAGNVSVAGTYYREMEKAGRFLPFGTPGTKYEAPRPRVKTKAEKKAAAKAQGPVLVKGEAVAIERFLQHSAPTRRAALAFLSKPYAEMVKAIRTDDKAADAFAALLVALEEVKESYLTIALHITRAASEIRRANVEADEADAKQARAK
jgi:hypothetical protein